ncbi:MAG: hypothetical protein JWN10_2331 [Solirubrobacterales bacterium]|nr:hypothetical protein [Solirubrobacterales bacterium]
MSSFMTRTTGNRIPVDGVLQEILKEIAVPVSVLAEAKRRRDLVLTIAMEHKAARARYISGSVAHGVHNKPLEDADCGVLIDRRFDEFRAFGPDAEGIGEGPEAFIQLFVQFITPRVQARGYPDAQVNLDGNRAIKFEFNETVDIDDWGPVDPYVDLIVGLARADGRGLWIPNRRQNSWDAADPQHHTWLMTERDKKALRVHRAHVLRLAKRAIKRDEFITGRVKVMCSWNLSALALEHIAETRPIGEALAGFLDDAAASIQVSLTEDPSPAIERPIGLPDGVTQALAAERLHEMADILATAAGMASAAGARAELQQLYGVEIDSIRERQRSILNRAFRSPSAAAATAAAISLPAPVKPTRSHGA